MVARAGGVSIGGLLVVTTLLHYTGAGGWMMGQLRGLSGSCAFSIPPMARSVGYPLCSGLSRGIEVTDRFSSSVGDIFRRGERMLGVDISRSAPTQMLADFGRTVDSMVRGTASSSDILNRMMRSGPSALPSARSLSDQFQQAVDSYTIGTHLRTSGNSGLAVPWLKQGASQPQGMGLYSQLSLGNLYRNGGQGVPADRLQAQQYYRQAADSLAQLQRNPSPQARHILGGLTTSPQELQGQIERALAELGRY